MVRERVEIQAFVTSYLARIGGALDECAPGVFRVELPREAAAELEGSSWGWWNSERAHATYYFTFDPERVDEAANVELIAAGSHRLEQIVASVRRLTRSFKVWLPAYECVERMARPPRYVFYRPFYVFLLSVHTNGSPPPLSNLHIAVDRVDRVALRQLAEALPGLPLLDGSPPQSEAAPFEAPELGLDGAFGLAFDELMMHLEHAGSQWADAARWELEQERARLEEFYTIREREGDDVSAERNQRLLELTEMMPRVQVHVRSVGELTLPVTYDEAGRAQHLTFELF